MLTWNSFVGQFVHPVGGGGMGSRDGKGKSLFNRQFPFIRKHEIWCKIQVIIYLFLQVQEHYLFYCIFHTFKWCKILVTWYFKTYLPIPLDIYAEIGNAYLSAIAANNISMQMIKFWYPADTLLDLVSVAPCSHLMEEINSIFSRTAKMKPCQKDRKIIAYRKLRN